MAKSDTCYSNLNGELSIEELIKIKEDGKEEEHISIFRVSKMPCVPEKLRDKDIFCFYCELCWENAFKQIKKTKKGYKVGNKTYKI